MSPGRRTASSYTVPIQANLRSRDAIWSPKNRDLSLKGKLQNEFVSGRDRREGRAGIGHASNPV